MKSQKTNSELRIERDRLSQRCDELRAAMRSGNKTATEAYNRDYSELLAIRRQMESNLLGVLAPMGEAHIR